MDGQCRTKAAVTIGIDSVPCAIVMAGGADQARAFRAVNSNTTRLSSLALHWAAISCGDAKALAIQSVCAAAGVSIAPYPKAPAHDQSLSPAAISRTLA